MGGTQTLISEERLHQSKLFSLKHKRLRADLLLTVGRQIDVSRFTTTATTIINYIEPVEGQTYLRGAPQGYIKRQNNQSRPSLSRLSMLSVS